MSEKESLQCSFSLDHYTWVLNRALELGYQFPIFKDYVSDPSRFDKVLLLRHDIDISLEQAAKMAQLEHDIGVRSTFFIRLNAKFYNVFATEETKQLIQICELGFEIGLHYDLISFHELGIDSVPLLHRQKMAIEALLGTQVWGLSEHMPTLRQTYLKDGQGLLDEASLSGYGFLYEAYTNPFVMDIKYISDSNRRWREGCICSWLGRQPKLYVLVHPYWWFPQPSTEPHEIIERLRQGD